MDSTQDNAALVQLSPSESVIAATLLDEAVNRLQYLSTVAPDVVAHREELSEFVGREIESIIDRQHALEARYEELVALRSSLRGFANKSRYKEAQDEIAEVTRDLRATTRLLCKNLTDNPHVAENLLKVQQHRNDLLSSLQLAATDLAQADDYASLRSAVSAENALLDEYQSLILREREAAKTLASLQEAARIEDENHTKAVAARRSEISQLKADLRAARTSSESNSAFFEAASRAAGGQQARQHLAEEAAIASAIAELEDALAKEEAAHETLDAHISRKQKDAQRHLAEWMAKLEDDVLELDQETADLEAQVAAAETDVAAAAVAVAAAEQAERDRADERTFQARMKACAEQCRQLRKPFAEAYLCATIRLAVNPPAAGKKGKKGKKGK
jgi:chromosome segregation ATPase